MKLGLINSAWVQAGRGTSFGIAKTRELGFDAIDIFADPLSDCNGKVHGDLPPGRGVVDFPPYLEAIKRLGIDDATISVELEYSPDPDHIVEWVAEAHDKTAGLMRAAGLRA